VRELPRAHDWNQFADGHGLQQPVSTELFQEDIQQQPFGTVLNQTTAKLAQHSVIETRIVKLQA
jgi:hypothetical protein